MMTISINETDIGIGNGLLAFNKIDAVLHPTNNFLWFSGTFERFKEVGGKQLEKDATDQGPIAVGQAIITSAGRLSATHIIHMAVWEQDLIANKSNIRKALISALKLAATNHCRSIALPIIGADSATFPLTAAIDATVMPIVEYCMQSNDIGSIMLLTQSHKEEQLLQRVMQSIESAHPRREENNNP